jgi:hypothetical protein
VDPVEAAVRDRARVRDGELERAAAGADRVRHTVPDDPRPQLGELLRRVAPVEHVEDVVEQLPRQLGERVSAPDRFVELRDLELVAGRGHRDDLLGQHVERIARDDGRLDVPVAHPLGHHRALEEVGPELREDAPARDLAYPVPGAADPLKPGGDRLGRLDLDHEVDRAHVDAEFERGRGHEAGQLARLEQVLDHQPFLTRQRAVMGARHVDGVAAAQPLPPVGILRS